MFTADLPSQGVVLERFELYSTKSHYYLVGHDKAAAAFKLLKLSRLEAELEAIEDPHIYNKAECTALLRSIRDGNLRIGGLQSVCKAAGVIGCFRFLEGFYLLLITQRRYQGSVCGHKVYGIDKTLLVPLVQSSVDIVQGQGRETAAEKRYRKLLLSGLELNKDFYFSYTYNLARTLQANLTADAPSDPFDSMFVWNEYLSRPLREALRSNSWVIPLIHGFWQQRSLALFGRSLTVSLIARRSKHFAGTRYLKRGVNFKGQVANDVETEQLIDAGIHRRTGLPELASIVQVRGSIPLYWNQEGITTLKPDITLQHYDPLYTATRLHFEDISVRYGNPVVVLNLVKSAEKRPRETILRKEFAISIAYINQQKPEAESISYIPWDFNYHAKQRGTFILADMASVIKTGLDATSFFSVSQAPDASAKQGEQVQLQHGVLRTNCIDCLDRTNVAQFAYGLAAMGHQLHGLGLADSPNIDAQSSAARALMDMYETMGNVLSRQYGGSEAHSTFFQRQRGDWEAATQYQDLLTSIRRFYSNTYTDAEKQDAINLFLGNFVPQHDHPALWELDSDYFLHTGQQFSKPSAAAAPANQPSPSTTYSNQQEHSPAVDSQQLSSSSTAYAHTTQPAGDSTQPAGSASQHPAPGIVLPQLQNADLQNVQQAEQKLYSHRASVQASADLRAAVKQTVSAAASCRDDQGSQGSSSPTTATLAVQPPAGTSPEAVTRLADAASHPAWLREATSAQASPCSPPQPPALSQTESCSTASSSLPSADSDAANPSQACTEPKPDQAKNGPKKGSVEGVPSGVAAGTSSSGEPAPANLALLQFARQSEVERLHRRPKLESFDKIIGNPANTPHHISLQAAPAQKAYLPQWLASPLGMHATQRTPAHQHHLPPRLSASAATSRFTTEDTEVGASHIAATTIGRNLQQLHGLQQPDPHDAPQTPPQALVMGPSTARQTSAAGQNPFASLSQAAFSPTSKPGVPKSLSLKRVVSEANMRKSGSSASMSPSGALQTSASLDLAKLEDSFVSLELQTVRPTAPRPFGRQTSLPSAPPPALRPPSRGKHMLPLQRARSLDAGPNTSPWSSRSGAGLGSGLSKRPSFGDLSTLKQSSLARQGSIKHSPRRRITFPTSLGSPAARAGAAAPLEPVQEGKQLPTSPLLPGTVGIDALKGRLLGEGRARPGVWTDSNVPEAQTSTAGLGLNAGLGEWWAQPGLPEDPLKGWLGREQQVRAAYKSLLQASQSPLDPFQQWALEDKYANLCNFVIHISMDGFTEGRGSDWRHTEGLVGSITCAESLLQDLAAQCKTTTA